QVRFARQQRCACEGGQAGEGEDDDRGERHTAPVTLWKAFTEGPVEHVAPTQKRCARRAASRPTRARRAGELWQKPQKIATKSDRVIRCSGEAACRLSAFVSARLRSRRQHVLHQSP